jgi:hypothetical protein
MAASAKDASPEDHLRTWPRHSRKEIHVLEQTEELMACKLCYDGPESTMNVIALFVFFFRFT